MNRIFYSLFLAVLCTLVLSSQALAVTPPTVQSDYVSFSSLTTTGATVSWVNGNGGYRLVVVSETDFSGEAPVNGNSTTYTVVDEGNWGNAGNPTVAPGYKILYNGYGSERSFDITGLTSGTTYYVKVFEYRVGPGDPHYAYLTTDGSANPRSFTTLLAAPSSFVSVTPGTTTFEISWVQPLAESFRITLRDVEDSDNIVAGYNNIDIGSNNSWVLSGLDEDHQYKLQVFAVKNGNQSLPGEHTFTTNADNTAPEFEIKYFADEWLETAKDLPNPHLKAGTYYLRVSADEPLSTSPTFTIAAEGTSNDDSFNSTQFRYSYEEAETAPFDAHKYHYVYTRVVDGADDADAHDLEEYYITGTDYAGNQAVDAPASGTATYAAYLDNTSASFTGRMIFSDHDNIDYARIGSEVSLTFTTTEPVETPTGTIGGHAAGFDNTAGNDWIATVTMADGDTEAAISYQIDLVDIAGNTSQFTTVDDGSTVTFDQTSPTFTTVTIASDNSTNNDRATLGDRVIVTLVSSETMDSGTMTGEIAGQAATFLNGGGNNWTASITLDGSQSDGSITFSLNADDMAGNNTGTVNSTTDPSSVTYDATPPTLLDATIYSDHTNTDYARVGSEVYVDFTGSEALSDVTVQVLGNDVTETATTSSSWTSTYTMQAADETSVTFTIDYVDLTGLSGSQTFSTTDGTTVTFDETDPVVTVDDSYSDHTNTLYARVGSRVVIEFSADETIESLSGTIGGGTASFNNTTGNTWEASYDMQTGYGPGAITFNISYADLAGNTGSIDITDATSTITFDEIDPTLSGIAIVSDNAYNTDKATANDHVTLSFSGSETIDLNNLAVEIGGHSSPVLTNATGDDWTASVQMQTLDDEGSITFSITYYDMAGNAGVVETTTDNSSTVTFDETGPVFAPIEIYSDYTNSDFAKTGSVVTVEFTSDEELYSSEVLGTIATNAATLTDEGSNVWTATYTMQGTETEGTIAFNIYAVDLAGNACQGETSNSYTVKTTGSDVTYDKTNPSSTFTRITSNNSLDIYKAKVDDVVTIRFETDEDTETITGEIAGDAIQAEDITQLSSYQYEITYMLASDDIEGSVTFSIDFDDMAGNSGSTDGAESSATVTFDKTPPVITALTMTTENDNHNDVARVGDKVILDFTSDEVLTWSTINGTIGGHDYSANVEYSNGTNWLASYTMEAGDEDGTITFTIDYQDEAGNPGTQMTSVISGSSATFDEEVPVLTSVGIYSNNAVNNGYATDDDHTIIDFTANEVIESITTEIAGDAGTTTNVSGNNWISSVTMTALDEEGSVTFTIDFEDYAGNVGTQVTTVNDASSVIFDNTAPSATITYVSDHTNTTWAREGSKIILALDADETLSSSTVTILNDTRQAATDISGDVWNYTYTVLNGDADGEVDFEFGYYDMAGNEGTAVTKADAPSTVTVDKVAPVPTVTSHYSNHTNNDYARVGSRVVVAFTTNEIIENTSGTIAEGSASFTDIAGSTSWEASFDMVSGYAPGDIAFNLSFDDRAGNSSTIDLNDASSTITFDEITPTLSSVTFTSSNQYNNDYAAEDDFVTLYFTASETLDGTTVNSTIGGHSATITNITGNQWTASTQMVNGDTEGVIQFSIDFDDMAGNSGTQVTSTTDMNTVTYDQTNPVLSSITQFSNNSYGNSDVATTGETVTVQFTSDETVELHAGTILGTNAIFTNTVANTWTAELTLAGTETEGPCTFDIWMQDLAGNSSSLTLANSTSTVTFDKTGPVLSPRIMRSDYKNDTYAKVGDKVIVSFTSNELLTDYVLPKIHNKNVTPYNVSGLDYAMSYTFLEGDIEDTDVALTLRALDRAGNLGTNYTTTTDAVYVNFDKTAPTITIDAWEAAAAPTDAALLSEVVTATFTSSETLDATEFTAYIAGDAVTPWNISGNEWAMSYTMDGADEETTVTFSLDYKDMAGNSGTQKTQADAGTSIVFDNTPPQLDFVGIASTNATTTLAKVDDWVTVTFDADETLATGSVVVTIQGNAADVITDMGGDQWTASYQMDASDEEGTVTFTLNFDDYAGNAGTEVTTVTNSSTVTFDRTDPTINVRTIASNNGNSNSLAKPNDVITLSFTAQEALDPNVIDVTIQGNNVTAYNDGGMNWIATYQILQGDTEGSVSFTLSADDLVGNHSATYSTTSEGSSVTYDKTLPVFNPLTMASAYKNDTWAKDGEDVTVTFTASETIIAVDGTINEHTSEITNTSGDIWTMSYTMDSNVDNDGIIDFQIFATDLAGNNSATYTVAQSSKTVTFDETAPSATFIEITSNNPNDNSLAKEGEVVTVYFKTNEAIEDETGTIMGNAPDGTTENDVDNYEFAYTMQDADADGVVEFSINFNDMAGNNTVITEADASTTVTYDDVVPLLSNIHIASSNTRPTLAKVDDFVIVSFDADETMRSTTMEGTIQGESSTFSFADGSWYASYQMTGTEAQGSVSFTIFGDDLAGNNSATFSQDDIIDGSTVEFDNSAPTLSNIDMITSNANYPNELAKPEDYIRIDFDASSDIDPNTITATIQTQTAVITDEGGNSWSATYDIQSSITEGVVAFTIDYADMAGNVGATESTLDVAGDITFDESAPIISNVHIESNNSRTFLAKENDIVTVSFSTNETLYTPSVVTTIQTAAATEVDVDGTNWYTSVTMGAVDEGSVSFTLNMTDRAGNPITEITEADILDGSDVEYDVTILAPNPVSIASNNGNNQTFAKPLDEVTLSFTVSEDIDPATVAVNIGNENAINTNMGGYNWTSTATMQAGDDDGSITFSIIYSDMAGNPVTEVNSITTGSNITYDEEAPVISSVDISSTNADPTLAAVGDKVMLEYTTNEVLWNNSVTATLAGNVATTSYNGSSVWGSTYTMQESDETGTVTFTLNGTDIAGNPFTEITTANTGSVTFDKTKPELSACTISSNNSNTITLAKTSDVVKVEFTSTEQLKAGTVFVEIQGQEADVTELVGLNQWDATYTMLGTEQEGSISFTITAYDMTGNSLDPVTAVLDASEVIYDKTPPQFTTRTIESDHSNTDWARVGSNVTVTLVSDEPTRDVGAEITGDAAGIVSGVDNMHWTATYDMLSNDVEGTVGFAVWATDLAGNSSGTLTSITGGSEVMFDKTPPSATYVASYSNNANNTAYAMSGDRIFVDFRTNEPVENETGTISASSPTITENDVDNYQAYRNLNGGDTPGTVAFSLNFDDMAGNNTVITEADAGSSTVTLDLTAPTLSGVSIYSDNMYDDQLAMEGTKVSVTFTADETLWAATMYGEIQGQEANKVSLGGNDWMYSYTMSNFETENAVSFTINATDIPGNAMTPVTAVTDASEVIFDRTVPTLDPVSIVSSNATNTLAKENDIVTVSFTASEDIRYSTMAATIQGKNANIHSAGGTDWIASYQMDNTQEEGSVTFTIDAKDMAGNDMTQVTSVVNSATAVTYDRTAPTAEVVTLYTNNTNTEWANPENNGYVEFTTSETVQNVAVTIIGQAATNISNVGNDYTAYYDFTTSDDEGPITFTVDFDDMAGNSATQITATTDNSSATFDRTPPDFDEITIESSNTPSSLAHDGDVITITFDATEELSSVAVIFVSESHVETNVSGDVWTSTFIADEALRTEGAIQFTAYINDLAGNTRTRTQANVTTPCVFDETPPSLTGITIASNNANNTTLAIPNDLVVVSFTSNEELKEAGVSATIGAGNATINRLTGTSWEASYQMTTATDNGTVTFTIDYEDMAGNPGTSQSAIMSGSNVTFDKDLPTLLSVEIASDNAYYTDMATANDNVSLTFTGSETLTAVSAEIGGHVAAITNTSGDTWTAEAQMLTGDTPGSITFSIDFDDAGGNAGTTVTATGGSSVEFDEASPIITNIHIESDNSRYTNLVKNTEHVFISFNTNETIIPGELAVQIEGNNATAYSTGVNAWAASYTILGTEPEAALQFTINGKDLAGNTFSENAVDDASSVTYDKTAPTLNPVAITSTNVNDNTLAKPGDVITVTFTAGEVIEDVTSTIMGVAADGVWNTGGNAWAASYTTDAMDAPDGEVQFTINANDMAGNPMTQVVATNSSTVTFDSQLPTLDVVSIASSNSDPSLAVDGDKITVSFTASEELKTSTVVVDIAGNTPSTVWNTGGDNWVATYNITSAFPDGNVTFSVDATDMAGNVMTTVTATNDGPPASSVRFDDTPPQLSYVDIESDNSNNTMAKENDIITLGFTSSEDLDASTVAVTIQGQAAGDYFVSGMDWEATYQMTNTDEEGSVTFTIDANDLAGNAMTTVTAVVGNASSVTYDRTAPVLSPVTIESGNADPTYAKFGDQVVLSYTTNETLMSNTASIYSSTGPGTPWSPTLYKYIYPPQLTDAEGPIPFQVIAVDLAGNQTTVTETTNSSTVTFDHTLPTLDVVSIYSNNADPKKAVVGDKVTLEFTASEVLKSSTVDVDLSGSNVTAYNTTGNDWEATYVMAGGEENGTITFTIDATDPAGNIMATVSATNDGPPASSVTFDDQPPSLSAVAIASSNSNPVLAKEDDVVTITFTASEDLNPTTVAVTIQGQAAGEDFVSGYDWQATYQMTNTDDEGSVTFTIDADDMAGNSLPTQSAVIGNTSSVNYDRTAPALSLVHIASNNANPAIAAIGDAVMLSITSDEAILNGSVNATIQTKGASVSSTSTTAWGATYTMLDTDIEGSVSFTLTMSDLAGNVTNTTSVTDGSSVIFDGSQPYLLDVSIASDNEVDNEKAINGSAVTVTFTANEVLDPATVIVTIDGEDAIETSMGSNTWTGSYVMANDQTYGSVSFTIDGSDLIGNPIAQVTGVTDGSMVFYDNIPPALTDVTIYSNNTSNSNMATANDEVVVGFTGTEELIEASLQVSIGGHNAAAFNNISGNQWETTVTMLSGDAEETITFSIDFSDMAGNPGNTDMTTDDGTSVEYDETAPTISGVNIQSIGTPNPLYAKENDIVRVQFTTDETLLAAGVTVTIQGQDAEEYYTGGMVWEASYQMLNTDTPGNVEFTINGHDMAGNAFTEITSGTGSVYFDITPPTLDNIAIASSNANPVWAKTGDVVTVSLHGLEELSSVTGQIAGETATPLEFASENWTLSYQMTGTEAQGDVEFAIYYYDMAGNAGLVETTTNNSSTVTFDSQKPIISAVSITSTNANNMYAKEGDVVTVSFVSNEELKSPLTATVAGNVADAWHVSGGMWNVTYEMLDSDADGEIPFAINGTDLAGNAMDQITLAQSSNTVTYDDTPPALMPVTIASNNANGYTNLAKVGDKVTVSFTANDELLTPVVSEIHSNTANVQNTGGYNWTADYTMQATDYNEGSVTFTIDFTDKAGNAGTTVVATTDISDVVYDRTAEGLSNVTIYSNNTNPELAVPGNKVMVRFDADEDLFETSIGVDIQNATADVNAIDSDTWEASIIMNAGHAAGSVTFTIDYTDLAGNQGTTVSATDDMSEVTYDKENPTLTAIAISSDNPNSDYAKDGNVITLSFTASEPLENNTATVTILGNPAGVTVAGENMFDATYMIQGTETQGNVNFTIDYKDVAGNAGTTATTTLGGSAVTYDRTAPSLDPVTIASSNAMTEYAKDSDIITLLFTENEDLDIDNISVELAGTNPTVYATSADQWAVTYTTTMGSPEGTATFTIDYTDMAGNSGIQVVAGTDAKTVTIDNTKPILSNFSIASSNTDQELAKAGDIVTVTFDSDEMLINDMAYIQNNNVAVYNDGGLSWYASYMMTGLEAENSVTFSVSAQDMAGNGSDLMNATNDESFVNNDFTSPLVSILKPADEAVDVAITTDLQIVFDEEVLKSTGDITLYETGVGIVQTIAASDPTVVLNSNTITIDINDIAPDTQFNVTVAADAFTDKAGNPFAGFTDETTWNFTTIDLGIYAISYDPVDNTANVAIDSDLKIEFAKAPVKGTGNVYIKQTDNDATLRALDINNADITISSNTMTITNNSFNGGPTSYYVLIDEGAINDGGSNTYSGIADKNVWNFSTEDKTAPNLTSISIASNNSIPEVAIPNDVVTISFTADEAVANAVVTIDGQDATETYLGSNNWAASYTMGMTETEGTLAFVITVTDAAANSASFTATTDETAVTFDRTKPTLTSVSIASSNSDNTVAMPGDYITVNFTSDSQIKNVVATIATQGAVVTDLGSNNWSASYQITSAADNGNVAFTLDFDDIPGNNGDQVTAITTGSEVAFDKTAPTLSSVGIVSNNSYNTSYAMVGNAVTVTFTGDETIKDVTATIGTNTADVTNTIGDTWTASYTMGSGDTEGTVAFTIDFKDYAGNSGTQVIAVTNGSSVTFDRTAPTLDPVSIASNNANTSLAKVGDKVTVSFTGEETIRDVTATIDGHAAGVTNTSGDIWVATYTMQASDTEGAIAFTVDFKDIAGNTATQVTAVTDGSSVSFDETAPTLPTVSIASNYTNTAKAHPGDVVTLSFTSDEPIANVTSEIAGSAAVVTNTGGNNWTATYTMQNSDVDGTVTFTVDFYDAVGNAGTQVAATTNSSEVVFDGTLPTLTYVNIESDESDYTKASVGSKVTVSFVGSETLTSVTASVEGTPVSTYNTTNNNWMATYEVQGTEGEGNITFALNFNDSYSNAGVEVTATTNGSSVYFDNAGPTLSNVGIASNNTTPTLAKVNDIVTVTFTGSETLDPNGVVVTIAGNNASVTNTLGNTWNGTYTMQSSDSDGAVPFTIDYQDASGNAGSQTFTTTNSSAVTFDKTVPTLSPVTIASSNSNNTIAVVGDAVTVTFTGSETLTSVTSTIEGHSAVVTNTSGNIWTASYTMTSSDVAGVVSFTIDFNDQVGNSGTQVYATTNSTQVTFVSDAPTLNYVAISSSNSTSSKVKVGEVVTVDFEADQTIQNVDVRILGHEVTETNTSSDIWEAVYTMTSGDDEGTVTFTIDYENEYGVAGSQTFTTTNSSSVVFDKTSPTLVSSNPANESTGFSTTGNFFLEFSETIQKGSGNIVIKKYSDDTVFETIDVSSSRVGVSSSTMAINPVNNLNGGPTSYYLIIANTVVLDGTGNNYAGISDKATLHFETADDSGPSILTYSPTDNATGVAVDASLVLTFSETISKGTGTIYIKKVIDNSVFASVNVSTTTVTGSSMTIPHGNFAENTQYYIVMASGVLTDGSGNAFAGISSSTEWNFTTIAGDPSAPTALNLMASSNSIDVSFTHGDGGRALVLVKENTGTIETPVDGVTYTANLDYGNAGSSKFDANTSYVVSAGTSNLFTVTNLAFFGTYYVKAYGFDASLNYETTGIESSAWCFKKSDHDINVIAAKDFVAKSQNAEVDLSWTTITEKNNSGFELYRANYEGDQQYKLVGTYENDRELVGLQNSTSGRNYKFTDSDNELQIGQRYTYKLVAVDAEGYQTELANTDVRVLGAPALSIYELNPNPVKSDFNLIVDLAESDVITVEILNAAGRVIDVPVNNVRYPEGRQAFQVSMNNIAAGTYFVRVMTSKDQVIKTFVYMP